MNLDSIRTSLEPTARVVAKKSGLLTRDGALVILVIILIVVNVLWFVYVKKERRRKKTIKPLENRI